MVIEAKPVPETEIPPGLIRVELGKGCLLLLTMREYQNALTRGRFYRRRLALSRRLAMNETGPLPGLGPAGDRQT